MFGKSAFAHISYIQENIGDSVLLIKCYELTENEEVATKTARNIAIRELTSLNRLMDGKHSFLLVAEQFTRVIYTYQSAENTALAKRYLDMFIGESATAAGTTGGTIGETPAFLLVVALVLMDVHELNSAPNFRLVGFTGRLWRCWSDRDKAAVETCLHELLEYIEKEELESEMVPWSDVWYYILARRLEKFIAGS